MSFPRYPKYNNGAEWLGKLPEHWAVTQLKRVVDPERQITYGIVQAGPHEPEGVPYIRPADMTDESGILSADEVMRTSRTIASAYTRSIIRPGDLVCSIGPSFGKVMITPPSLDGANLTQGTARIAIKDGFSARFYFWVLRSWMSVAQWESSVGGATFGALNLGPLSETLIPVPSVAEQRAIATFLGCETQKIDALVAEQQRLIELLKEKRQAVVSHAVTKGLNRNAAMKESGVDHLGKVPRHWTVLPLMRLTPNDRQIMYGIVLPGPHVEDGVPIVKGGDVKAHRLNVDTLNRTTREIEAGYVRSRLRGGDIVYSIRGSIGEVAIVPDALTGANLTQDAARVAPRSDVHGPWLFWTLQAREVFRQLDEQVTGATIRGINISALKRAKIPAPPVHEQIEMASFLNREAERFETLVQQSRRAISLLQERRTALISAAVTGKIDVRRLANTEAA